MFTAVGNYSPMRLTPEQCCQVAAVFESSAVDMRVPPQHRAAFARKADWFHMLARIRAKKDAAPVKVPHSEKTTPASRPEITLDELLSVGWMMPKARSTVAEQLERAREERRSAGPLRLYLGSGQPK